MSSNDSNSKREAKSTPATSIDVTEKVPMTFEFENLDGVVDKVELNDAWLITGACGGSGSGTCAITPKGSSGKACGSGA